MFYFPGNDVRLAIGDRQLPPPWLTSNGHRSPKLFPEMFHLCLIVPSVFPIVHKYISSVFWLSTVHQYYILPNVQDSNCKILWFWFPFALKCFLHYLVQLPLISFQNSLRWRLKTSVCFSSVCPGQSPISVLSPLPWTLYEHRRPPGLRY